MQSLLGSEQTPRAILRSAIVTTIDRNTLRQLLAEGTPSRDFDALVRDANYSTQVFELIGRAIDEGWIRNLVEMSLRLRAENRQFVAAVKPIVERLESDEIFVWDAPHGTIDRARLIWIILPLGIIAASAGTMFFGSPPGWLIAALAAALAFLALGIFTLMKRVPGAVVGLYSKDQRVIPGLGASGLLLVFGLAAALALEDVDWSPEP